MMVFKSEISRRSGCPPNLKGTETRPCLQHPSLLRYRRRRRESSRSALLASLFANASPCRQITHFPPSLTYVASCQSNLSSTCLEKPSSVLTIVLTVLSSLSAPACTHSFASALMKLKTVLPKDNIGDIVVCANTPSGSIARSRSIKLRRCCLG